VSCHLTQPSVLAEAYEVIDALSAYRVPDHETFHQCGFVVPRCRSLIRTCSFTSAGNPSDRNACTTSGTPPSAVRVSGKGSGSTSKSRGDSVGEGLAGLLTPQFYWHPSPCRCKINAITFVGASHHKAVTSASGVPFTFWPDCLSTDQGKHHPFDNEAFGVYDQRRIQAWRWRTVR
jgi:hypothetical protein